MLTWELLDATGGDRDFCSWSSAATSQSFYFPNNVHAFDDFAKYDMLFIKP
jgi:hypothetical protein